MPKDARASEAFDLLKQGREKDARAILEQIVKDDSADAAVLETLGDVREKLGDKEGALDAYAGAITHLRARGELKRALGVIELMLIVHEHGVWARREGAEIKDELGDFAGCWRDVVAACEILIGRDDQRAAMRMCREFADVLPEAAPALQIARRLGPHDGVVDLCAELGYALRRREKLDDAAALFAHAVDLAPDRPDILHARAGVLVSMGRFPEARLIVDKLLHSNARDMVALTLLERLAAATGDAVVARSARERLETMAGEREDRTDDVETPWSEDTAELRRETDDDPTDLER